MSRLSPGSPSKWIATRSPLPASTCRSTQLYATLRLPPTNHFATGASDQSRTSVHGVAQSRRRAWASQKASRSRSASACNSGPAFAAAAKAALGGYTWGASVALLVISACLLSGSKSTVVARVRVVTRGRGRTIRSRGVVAVCGDRSKWCDRRSSHGGDVAIGPRTGADPVGERWTAAAGGGAVYRRRNQPSASGGGGDCSAELGGCGGVDACRGAGVGAARGLRQSDGPERAHGLCVEW